MDEDTEVQQDVQRVEHLRDSVCFHTALFHRCARQADGSSEKPTPARQHDIKIQEEAVRAQPGDARASAVRSWVLDDHRRAGWQMGMVVPRGETSETPDPVLQRGPPDLVVGRVCEEHFRTRSGGSRCRTGSGVSLVSPRGTTMSVAIQHVRGHPAPTTGPPSLWRHQVGP